MQDLPKAETTSTQRARSPAMRRSLEGGEGRGLAGWFGGRAGLEWDFDLGSAQLAAPHPGQACPRRRARGQGAAGGCLDSPHRLSRPTRAGLGLSCGPVRWRRGAIPAGYKPSRGQLGPALGLACPSGALRLPRPRVRLQAGARPEGAGRPRGRAAGRAGH